MTGRGAAAVLLAVLLTACGGRTGMGSGTDEPSSPAAAVPGPQTLRPTSLPDELPEPLPLPSRAARGDLRTLTGTVVAGVEEGCLLLPGPGGDYLLLGGDPAVVRAGATVTVVGRADPSLLTTCQQGVPFTVSSASRS